MAREKHYFRSPEIAHIWANQGSTFGRCPSSMTFDGDKFYSYSTVIANRIRHKGKIAYILDGATFSSATSGHQSHVRRPLGMLIKPFIFIRVQAVKAWILLPKVCGIIIWTNSTAQKLAASMLSNGQACFYTRLLILNQ